MSPILLQPEVLTLTYEGETIVLEVAAVGVQGPPGVPGSSGGIYEGMPIGAAGQTVFNLSQTPAQPAQSRLFLNGVKAHYGTEYLINLSIVTWLSSLRLEVSDRLEIYYS